MKKFSLLMVSCLFFMQLNGMMDVGAGAGAGVGGRRNDVEAPADRFQAVDTARIQSLIRKILPYRHNTDLNSVYDVLDSYNQLIGTYNDNIDNLALNRSGIQLPFQAVQDGLYIDAITLDAAERHVDVLIASENIYPQRSIQKFGRLVGSLYYIKNLCMPTNYYEYITAGVGSLIGLTVLKNVEKSNTTVHIHAPSNAQISIENDSSAARIAKTLGLFMITAGGAVAGKQIFDSWMYKADSREKLVPVMTALRTANQSIMRLLDNYNIRHDVHGVNDNVDAVRADILNAHSSVQTRLDGVDEGVSGVRAAVVKSKSELRKQLQQTHGALDAKIEESKSEVKDQLGVVQNVLSEQIKRTEAEVRRSQVQEINLLGGLVTSRCNSLDRKIDGVAASEQALLEGQRNLADQVTGIGDNVKSMHTKIDRIPENIVAAVSIGFKTAKKSQDSVASETAAQLATGISTPDPIVSNLANRLLQSAKKLNNL